jgi:hypothetical protein
MTMPTSAVDIALSGFRLAAARPKAVAVWSAAALGLGFATNLLTALIMGPEFTRLTAPGGPPAGLDWGALAAGYLVIIALTVGGAAVICTAVYRAVLRPGDDAAAYLRLGPEELRMVGLFVVVMGLYLLAALAMSIVIGIVITVSGVAAAGSLAVLSAAGIIGALVPLVTLLLLAVLFGWLGVRLSLAGPMTLDTGAISLAAAWKLTRGHFWRLLGAFALSWLLLLVLWMVSFALAAIAAAAFGGAGGIADAMGLGGRGRDYTLQGVISPAQIAYLVGASVLTGLVYAVMLAPTAIAYRDLRPSADVEETFG